MKKVLIQANAKLNLSFKILGRRPDGYHEIESIFQSVDLSDFLLFEKAKNNYFSGGIICPDSDNLILKAKNYLEKVVGKKLTCHIHLQKVIPIAAGLGGGSADAAAAILGLNLLYNLGLAKKELAKIGKSIGADVPFFFYGGTCKVGGIGEKITPVKTSIPKFFVIFRPHKRIETKKMYELHDATGKDFPALAQEICPDIKNIERYLAELGITANLSGSGPTIFCGLDSYRLAQKISQGYYPRFNGDIFICQPQKEALKVLCPVVEFRPVAQRRLKLQGKNLNQRK